MSKLDERVWAGVDVLLDDYARVDPEDQVLVAYTPESREPAAWVAAALKMRGNNLATISMQPMRDETFAHRLAAALPRPGARSGKLVVITVERDTMSHTEIFREALSRYNRCQWLIARIINASEELFVHGMNVRSAELSALNTSLLRRLMGARELRVKTAGGSDFRVTLDSDKYRWISNRGAWTPGRFIVLPAGEVATYPVSVDGVLVADGAFNVNVFTKLDARLGQHPVRFRIKDSKVVDFECASRQVSELLRVCFARPFATSVGELGFGTNTGIAEFVSMNSHINERRPGVHIGFGQHNQSIYVVEHHCDIHMDMIASGGAVWVDDDPEPIDLQRVMPSSEAHPTLVLDEDIDGDCCGLWLDEEQARSRWAGRPDVARAEP
ncbi:hypothetical protein SOCE26_100470 [Sorangium cellulosum]|uniref:Crocagin biosynthetic protein CgnE/B domain-containing protein n=1 Tax=Sorangium cellulosum TaxID=56 RepID=A0A2L0FAP0_SORCE|nr:hypothetical protein [Sorangium cellulosum]AUX48509.1 hypothetical protein SOCE26_100470 [Sorangium cellulosum]